MGYIVVGFVLLILVPILGLIVWIKCGIWGVKRICTPGSGRNGYIWVPIGCILGPVLMLFVVLLKLARDINENRFDNQLPESRRDSSDGRGRR